MPTNQGNIRIALASGSPRRRELLATMRLEFRVVASDAVELLIPNEQPADLVQRLSLAKAQAALGVRPGDLVIAADTIVVLDDEILGKPRDAAHAIEMLQRLRNRQHWVYTGVALLEVGGGRTSLQTAMTPVTMRDYRPAEIAAYVASGDPLDKAGAYAIQSSSFDPIAHIEGCYTNVMGLPLCHLYRVMLRWRWDAPIHPLQACPYARRSDCPWAQAILDASPTDADRTNDS